MPPLPHASSGRRPHRSRELRQGVKDYGRPPLGSDFFLLMVAVDHSTAADRKRWRDALSRHLVAAKEGREIRRPEEVQQMIDWLDGMEAW